MRLIFTPFIWRVMERKRALGLASESPLPVPVLLSGTSLATP